MPQYLYRCTNKHEINVMHGMTESVKIFCPVCGEVMWRKPQAHAVKWACFIEASPAVREHLNSLSEKREDYERVHGH